MTGPADLFIFSVASYDIVFVDGPLISVDFKTEPSLL